MMFLNDINEMKGQLGIALTNNFENKGINFWIEYASGIIEEYIARGDLSRQERTEYKDGNNQEFLVMDHRPIYSITNIWESQSGNFGFTSGSFSDETLLVSGSDYALKIDQPDGSSRCGMIVKINNRWLSKPTRFRGYLSTSLQPNRGSIKVVYDAGYTIDNLPSPFRVACVLLVAKIRHILPFGLEIGSESYEERSISFLAPQKGFLMSLVAPLLVGYKNRRW